MRGFDYVRGLAASAVVVHHVEQIKALVGLPSHWHTGWVQSLGGAGVDVFFGLSGFVITQALVRERARDATGGLGPFYARRALRILPLYLALVIVAFGPLPTLMARVESDTGRLLQGLLSARDAHYTPLLVLHLLGVPNAALVAYPGVPFASQLWSVGAEMQFYLLWPLCFVVARNVWIGAALAAASAMLAGAALGQLGTGALGLDPALVDTTRRTLGTIHGSYLLAGICAAAFVGGPLARIRHHVESTWVSRLALATIAALLVASHLLPLGEYLAPLVVGVALIGLTLGRADATPPARLGDHLGRISYSIYVWHLLVIGAVVLTLDRTLGLQPWGTRRHLALYVGVAVATVVVASVSYRVIELPFQRLGARRRAP